MFRCFVFVLFLPFLCLERISNGVSEQRRRRKSEGERERERTEETREGVEQGAFPSCARQRQGEPKRRRHTVSQSVSQPADTRRRRSC